jgi:prolyl-tRNA editing enzyme YbaK/EbsC (Cys-tRNA(Pro) deacylase)
MHPTAARLRQRGLDIESIGGVPPLGHDVELLTTIDQSLRRFEVVWAAAGTPHDVFPVGTEALIRAIPGAQVTDVS